MRIGLAILPTAETIDVAVLVQRAEALGFESLWTPEQNVLPVNTERPVPRLWGDIVDPLILLARASAVSTTIKLGTAVSVIPERDPLVLAKQVATLWTGTPAVGCSSGLGSVRGASRRRSWAATSRIAGPKPKRQCWL